MPLSGFHFAIALCTAISGVVWVRCIQAAKLRHVPIGPLCPSVDVVLTPPRIRPTRRPLPSEALLLQLKAEAGRVDGNLAQILKQMNWGDFVPVDEVAEAASAVRDFYIKALETLRRGA